jgi:hypothetical protein
MKEAENWLRSRVPCAPAQLLKTMISALPESADSLPDALAAASVRLYQEVVGGTGEREDALPLLAADALLTHAFQAQAEIDPAGLANLADRYSARGRLGQIPT